MLAVYMRQSVSLHEHSADWISLNARRLYWLCSLCKHVCHTCTFSASAAAFSACHRSRPKSDACVMEPGECRDKQCNAMDPDGHNLRLRRPYPLLGVHLNTRGRTNARACHKENHRHPGAHSQITRKRAPIDTSAHIPTHLHPRSTHAHRQATTT